MTTLTEKARTFRPTSCLLCTAYNNVDPSLDFRSIGNPYMAASPAVKAALTAMENGRVLTGVPALWRACVGGIALVASTARYREEFQIAAIDLELEKLRLYKWGAQIGLTRFAQTGLDVERPRYLKKGTTSILRYIESQLRIGIGLQKKYSPRLNTSQYDCEIAMQAVMSPQNPLQQVFEDLYADINEFTRDDQRTFRRRTAWTTADRTQFSEMIKHIRDHINRLWALHRLDKDTFDRKMCEGINSSTAIQVLGLLKEVVDGPLAKAASERLGTVSDVQSLTSTATEDDEVEELRKMLKEKEGEIESMRAVLELQADLEKRLKENIEKLQTEAQERSEELPAGGNKDSEDDEKFSILHHGLYNNNEVNDAESLNFKRDQQLGVADDLQNHSNGRKTILQRTSAGLWFLSMYLMGLAMHSIILPEPCHWMDGPQ